MVMLMKYFAWWSLAFFILSTPTSQTKQMEVITFGGGCFWCIEAVFASLEGIESAQSGYMGGHIKNPAYREVCTGRTGHAEVVRVTFDPKRIHRDQLMDVFFTIHDPTTLNRQGADVGTQYRSCIFYTTAEQKQSAEKAIERWQQAHPEAESVVTEVLSEQTFYLAEDYHQQYYDLNGEAPYCRAVIAPKMKKAREAFSPLFKAN